MKKNLKKAISAVIALALSLSLIPASFAAKLVLTDVADTASYATAVNTLVALDIINGYEDNTFKPDDLITRAEVTKVVVAALNKTDMAEGMTGSTGFADMDETSAWANGYINAGVQEGFINGMENNTFAPKANVTYAQIVKMLVASMGYEDYAQYMGGWPNGYLAIANAENITKGVKKGANENVTRAEVAQLVYNALNTPIVENTGLGYQNGVLVPTISKMDGTDAKTPYKSILTENFNAYVVEGKVAMTAKSDSGDSLEADEVNFEIVKFEEYDNEDYAKKTTINEVKVGDTDAANYENTYAKAIIMVNEDDNTKTLVSFEPSNKNKTYEFSSEMIDEVKLYSDDKLWVLPSESATKAVGYKVATDASLYVNGYKYDYSGSDLATAIDTYVIDNKGNVKLVSVYDGEKVDDIYDVIYVDCYAVAQVDEVVENKIWFKDEAVGVDSIELDKEDNEKLVYSIVYNDEEIELAQLKEDDVLSIKWNVNVALDGSNEYEIFVSRDVVTGKLTSKNSTDEVVVVAGTEYSFVGDYQDDNAMPLAREYKLYLDVFGNIYKHVENTSAIKYAILDKVTVSSDEYKATLFTAEGTTKLYEFTNSYDVTTNVTDKAYTTYNSNSSARNRKPVYDRVVEYRVNSSGQITYMAFIAPDQVNGYKPANGATPAVEATAKEYDVDYKSIGSIDMDESTKIFDAKAYVEKGELDETKAVAKELKIASLSSLADETPYTAYAYGSDDQGAYPIVLITMGEGKFNETTRFAVVAGPETVSFDEETQEEHTTLPVLYKGEETTLSIENAVAEATTLNKGDVILFTVGAEELVDKIVKVMDAKEYSDLTDTLKATYAAEEKDGEGNVTQEAEFNISADKDLINGNDAGYSSDFSNKFTNDALSTESDEIKFVFGPIVEKKDASFTIGVVGSDNRTNVRGTNVKIKVSDNTNVYTYNYSKPDKAQLSVSSTAGISNSRVPDAFKPAVDVIDWKGEKTASDGITKDYATDYASFALALVVGGEAVDTLVFLNR